MDEHRRVLGVDASASPDEIKRAYREKVREYHPDLSDRDDAEEQFKRVKRAYEALMTASDASRHDAESDRRTWGDVQIGKDYNTGWSLVYQEARGSAARRWAVVGQSDDADGFRYINREGESQSEPFFFEDRETTERTYSEYRAGVGPGSGSSEPDDEGPAIVFAEELDTLWNLYRDEGDAGDRRWLVGARVEGSDHYVNDEGEHQTDPCWFEGREPAIAAYERYVGTEEPEFGTATAGGEPSAEPVTEPSLLTTVLDTVYRRRRTIKLYAVVAAVGLAGYVLGALGVGPAAVSGGAGAGGTSGGSAADAVSALDPLAVAVAIGSNLRRYAARNGDIVLPVSALYAAIAGAYLINRFLRSPPTTDEN